MSMITKEQAQTVKNKLEKQFPDISFGLGKDGDDWTVEARNNDAITKLPTLVDGVRINYKSAGKILPQKN